MNDQAYRGFPHGEQSYASKEPPPEDAVREAASKVIRAAHDLYSSMRQHEAAAVDAGQLGSVEIRHRRDGELLNALAEYGALRVRVALDGWKAERENTDA